MNEELQKQFCDTIEQLTPDDRQRERIWQQIQQNSQQTRRHRKSISAARVALAGICALLLCAATGIGVNAATDGALFSSLQKLWKLPEEKQLVAHESLNWSDGIYASQLFGCSEQYLIFANERGLAIYDRAQTTLVDVIDLQEIDCNYFNAESKTTRVVLQDEMVLIYNENTDGSAPTQLYRYDLALVGQPDALALTEDTDEIQSAVQQWQTFAKDQLLDTFSNMLDGEYWNDLVKYGDAVYSQYSIIWMDAQGNEQLSCLVTTDKTRYELYTCPLEEPLVVEITDLLLDTENAQEYTPDRLPAFAYSGDNIVLKAICDYMQEQSDSDPIYYLPDGGVFIPAPVIYETVSEGDELVVFANLWSFGYSQSGNTLNCESGGEQPSRLRLVPDGNGGYTVTEHLSAGDGADYMNDTRAFCEGYDVDADAFIETSLDHEAIRKELVRMYVQDNQLNIQYYKDYGWDPVALED